MRRQSQIDPRPEVARNENLIIFGRVVFEKC